MFKDMKLFRIFNKRIAMELIKRGYHVVDCYINRTNDKLIVFCFNDSKEIHEEFNKIKEELSNIK